MKFFKKLEINLLTSIIVLTISIISFAISSFLLTSVNKDIPLGFIFSGGVISLLYLVAHFLFELDKKEGKALFSILSLIIRLVVIVTSMVMIGLMSYAWDLKIFNLFVFVGVYTFGAITFVLAHVVSRKE